jgi:capsular exopolysaccharide synthesis family protein
VQQSATETLSLEQVTRVIRRRLWLVVACVVLASVAAIGFSKSQPKEYSATASLAFQSNSLSRQVAGLPAAAVSGSSLISEHANNVELVKLGDVAEKTAALVGRGLTRKAVTKQVSVAGKGESNIVTVAATASSAPLASEIANTYANEFVSEQQAAEHAYYAAALALVNRQLAALPVQQRTAPLGLALHSRAETLTLLADLNGGGLHVAQEALTPTGPSGPKTTRNTLIGAFLGLLVGLGLAFTWDALDRRLREPEEIAAIYGLPLLGGVPMRSALSTPPVPNALALPAPPPAAADAFDLIRAHLRSFKGSRRLRTVLLASAARGEGKTTIARHLAEAVARADSRVLLIEADLRAPTLRAQLDLEPAPGLADVLGGTASLEEAIRPVTLAPAFTDASGTKTLDVLLAGGHPTASPAELLESTAMEELLANARSTYDFVVVDAPPLTAVADAFPLLSQVDGVIVVGRVGSTRREAAERLREVLASSGAPMVGVIANGLKMPQDSGYYGRLSDDSDHAPAAAATRVSQSQELASTSNV